MLTPYKNRTAARDEPRISAREAAVFVAESLALPMAAALRKAGGDASGDAPLSTLRPAALSDDERGRFLRALERDGIERALVELQGAMKLDRRTLEQKPGKRGAPARHWLREAVRDLLAAIEARGPESDRCKVAAMLLHQRGLDAHPVFWAEPKAGQLDPIKSTTGRARVRYIAKRLAKIAEERRPRARKKVAHE